MLFRFKIIAVLTILIQGCSVGPNYKTPEFDLPSRFNNISNDFTLVDQLNNPAANPWWQCFDDKYLNYLIVTGIQKNNDVAMALARLNEARAYQGEAFLGLFPDVNLNGSYSEGVFGTATNPFFKQADRDFRAYRGGMDLSWELDLFGRVRKILEGRTATSESLNAALDDVLVSIQAQIAESYIQFRTAQAERKIVKNSTSAQKESLKITQALFDAGAANKLDLSLAESQWHSTKAKLPKLKAIELAALNRLAVLTGNTKLQIPRAVRNSSSLPVCYGKMKILAPELLIRQRPDIRVAEKQLAVATANIGLETTEFFPRIYLNGSIGVEAPNLSGLNDTNSEYYSWGPSFSWKILNAGRIAKRINAAGANAEHALQNYQKSVLLALEDAKNAINNYRTEKQAVLALKNAADSARNAAKIAREQYQVGALDYYRVLQTETNTLQVEQAELQTNAALSLAHIHVYKAFSGGWVEHLIRQKK